MGKQGTLLLASGFYSAAGRTGGNQDYAGICVPGGQLLALRGAVAAVADGVAGGNGGRIAAELAVRQFIEGYYGLPRTLGITTAADRALSAVNDWLHAQGRSPGVMHGAATTFSGLLLRRCQAWIVHVGDTRVYQLRNGTLQQLTEDHVLSHPDMRHVLHRAVGLDCGVRIDFSRHTLKIHDRLLICSDGVHAALGKQRIAAVLAERSVPEKAARRLVEQAFKHGSHDDATALVLDILDLPPPDETALAVLAAELPVAELPSVGEEIDDFSLHALLADGRYSRLFRATDLRTSEQVVLKFPHPRLRRDEASRASFLREAWIAACVRSPLVGDVLEPDPDRQSRLYIVMPYYQGETLEQRLLHKPLVSFSEGVRIGINLAKAIYALHRLQIIHQDIKPANVMILGPDEIKLLDLGVAHLIGFQELVSKDTPGTASFMAPELFAGSPANELSDVFALGVTLYRMFSAGSYPYGEVEPFSRPRFGRYVSLARYRPDLPAWLDALLARAVSTDLHERFGDAMELALELESGLAHGGQVLPRCSPLIERDPVRFWRGLAIVLLLAFLVAAFV